MSVKNIPHIWQWLAVLLLAIACFSLWKCGGGSHDAQGNKSETQYVSVSDDKTLSELKRENRELYDSIRRLSNVSEALQVKYVVKYKTDTVHVTKSNLRPDSVYHYRHESDTINYDLDIKGNDVKWFKLGFSMNDSLMIVTRSKNGRNEVTISHGENTEITNTTVFVPKKNFFKKFKDRTYVGIGVGAGYGVLNKKPDIYVGVSAGVRLWK